MSRRAWTTTPANNAFVYSMSHAVTNALRPSLARYFEDLRDGHHNADYPFTGLSSVIVRQKRQGTWSSDLLNELPSNDMHGLAAASTFHLVLAWLHNDLKPGRPVPLGAMVVTDGNALLFTKEILRQCHFSQTTPTTLLCEYFLHSRHFLC